MVSGSVSEDVELEVRVNTGLDSDGIKGSCFAFSTRVL